MKNLNTINDPMSIRPSVLQALNGPLERLGNDPLPAPQAAVRRIQVEGPTGQVALVLHRVSGRLHLNSS
jgi:hypothetical protein